MRGGEREAYIQLKKRREKWCTEREEEEEEERGEGKIEKINK